MASITSLPSGVSGGSLVLLETQTASSSGTIQFTSGIDSTYKEYIIKIINVHPQTDNQDFSFNLSADGGSNYNVTKTSTFFNAYADEGNSDTSLNYVAGSDLAQGTGFQRLFGIGGDNDQNSCGTLHLFDPSNTTFVKHFIFVGNDCDPGDFSTNRFVAGYANTTSAVNAIQFKFASGNIDAGTFKLYGVS
jgi:hypothetical protein